MLYLKKDSGEYRVCLDDRVLPGSAVVQWPSGAIEVRISRDTLPLIETVKLGDVERDLDSLVLELPNDHCRAYVRLENEHENATERWANALLMPLSHVSVDRAAAFYDAIALAVEKKVLRGWSAQEELIPAGHGWPPYVSVERGTTFRRNRTLGQIVAEVARLCTRLTERISGLSSNARENQWDVFISHAHEDKDAIARPLAFALREAGLRVWFDETELAWGASLRRAIDRGLAHCRCGIVIVSPAFLRKEWPQRELDALTAREIVGAKVVLPLWHEVSRDVLMRHSPLLADRIAIRSDIGLPAIVEAVKVVLK